jgi:hypothetical protein
MPSFYPKTDKRDNQHQTNSQANLLPKMIHDFLKTVLIAIKCSSISGGGVFLCCKQNG